MKGHDKRQEKQLAEEVQTLQRRLREIQADGFLYTEEELIIQDKLEYAESILATMREPLIVLDHELRVVSANQSFYDNFKLRLEDTVRRFIYDLGERQWDIPVLRKLLGEVLPQRKIVTNFQVEHDFNKIGKRIMIINAEWIPREAVRPQLILLAIEDLTELKKIKASLWDSQLKTRAIFDQTFQFIGLITLDGTLIKINKTAMEFAGINESDCLGKPFWDTPWWTHSKEMQDKLREAVTKAASGETVFFEATHPAAGGTIHYIDFSLKPIKDENGKPVFLIPEGRDITARRKAEADLRHEKERVELLYYLIPSAIFSVDKERRITSWNSTAAKLTGHTAEEVMGKECSIFAKEPCQDKCGLYADDVSKPMFGKECIIKRKDGEAIVVSKNADLLRDLNNDIVGGIESFEDITEHKKLEAEREIALKWQQDVSVLQQSLLASVALEGKLRIITESIVRIFKADFCRIWLIGPGDLCEKGCVHAEVTEGPHACHFREKCLHLIMSSGRYTHIDGKGHARVPLGCYKVGLVASGKEHKLLTNDVVNDSMVYNHEWARQLGLVSFAGYQLKVPGGEKIGVLALFAKHPITLAEDAMLDSLGTTTAFITQQSIADEEVIQARAMKASSEIKSDFTGMVSHELRTPLAAIKEGVSVVLDQIVGSINEEQKKYLEITKNNVDRLDRLISGVLAFQALESGKMEFKMEENDINEAVKEIREGMLPLAEKKNLDLVCQLDKDLPRITFDRDKIIQVLANLVNNALKFTEKGGIAIITGKRDNLIQVTVKDTGPGIREEDMQKLFQEFTQLRRSVGGTGLGLSICKKIIEAHRGKIWAESPPAGRAEEFGSGTAFYFILPIQERRV